MAALKRRQGEIKSLRPDRLCYIARSLLKMKNKNKRVNKGGKREEWRAVDEEIRFFSFISRTEDDDVCVYMYVYVYACECVQICHMKINQLKRGRRSARGRKEGWRR